MTCLLFVYPWCLFRFYHRKPPWITSNWGIRFIFSNHIRPIEDSNGINVHTYTEPRSNKHHWLFNHRLSMLRSHKERCVQGGPLLAINWSYNLCKCSMNGLLWLSHPYINWVCFTLLITGRGDLVSVFGYPWMNFREWSHCNHCSLMEKLLRLVGFLFLVLSMIGIFTYMNVWFVW